jgi:hypothetical protein
MQHLGGDIHGFVVSNLDEIKKRICFEHWFDLSGTLSSVAATVFYDYDTIVGILGQQDSWLYCTLKAGGDKAPHIGRVDFALWL